MPQRKCAAKRLKADKKRVLLNLHIKTNLKKTIKSYLGLISQNKIEEAKTTLNKVLARIDKAVSKGFIHKNNAARKKSSLTRKLNSLLKK